MRFVSAQASIAIILSSVGERLDIEALSGLPIGKLVSAQFECGEQAVCAAATVEHDCSPEELVAKLRPWAARRGWVLTVAPLRRRR